MPYGVDDKLRPQRQTIEAEEVSADGLIWVFRLRPGLKFHDGEPVLAKDAVASLSRWSARAPVGQMIKAIHAPSRASLMARRWPAGSVPAPHATACSPGRTVAARKRRTRLQAGVRPLSARAAVIQGTSQ
jgi:ABC-type transport system substrate-binding protein